MSYRVHLRTAFVELDLREVLQSKPHVLLGVSTDAESTLGSIQIGTVYDLALATLFANAARVVQAASDPTTVLAQYGQPPADLIDPALPAVPFADLPQQPVTALRGVTAALATLLHDTMAIDSVRDLAQWPPYLAAVKLVTEAFASERAPNYDRDAPPDLIPRAGELATQRVRYTSTVLIESKPSEQYKWKGDEIDVTKLGQVGFNDVAFGAILTFNQTWSPKAVALGQLLHSLPLAPGESTRLTMTDWLRRVAASTDEEEAQSEQLSNAMSRSTAISEVTNAVAREFQSGDSVAGSTSTTASGSAPGIAGLFGVDAGFGATFGTAGTYSTSSGSRTVTASALQSIDSRTQQNSALARTKRAAIVSEVSESDKESINTRVVINNNHMHALSIQYYEVVQTWQTELRLNGIERCIFIPMRLVNFRNEQVIRRYLAILVRAALDRETRDLLLQFRHTVVLEFTFERFADTAIKQILAQLQTTVQKDVAAGTAITGPPLALAADVEKLLLVQSLQARVNALRRTVRAESDAAVRQHLFERYDRVNEAQFELDRETIVKSVAWDTSRGVSKVTLQHVDSKASVLSRTGDLTSNSLVHPELGTALPIDRIRSIRVSIEAAKDTNPSDLDVVPFFVLAELRGRALWLDFSFVTSRAQPAEITVLQLHPPVDVSEIANRLMAAQLYYSQRIWMRAERQALLMQLSRYVYDFGGGQSVRVVEYIDPVPVTVAGNYVAFRFTYETDETWKAWKAKELKDDRPRVSLVPLPTGGVFAEAVMGEFNSGEKLDATRFWKWQESPIPNLAPEIADAIAGQHTKVGAPSPTAMPDSVLSLQAALPLPALGGSDVLLKQLMVSKLFNDMSGVDITKGLLKASIEAARDGDAAALKQNSDTLKAINDAFAKVVKSAANAGPSLISTAKGMGSMLNLAGKGSGSSTPASAAGAASAPDAAGAAVDAGTAGGGAASGMGDFVVGGGSDALASVAGEIGPVLEAVGPAAAALI
jgi:hypothetical protein